MVEVHTGHRFGGIKGEIVCSVERKEVGVGWRVRELTKRNGGSDIDLKICSCSRVDVPSEGSECAVGHTMITHPPWR